MEEEKIRKVVRDGYSKIAKDGGSCCAPTGSCCSRANLAEQVSRKIGYRNEQLTSVPEGANLGLGCGNPISLASLKEGETVLDLGAGAGFDCFLAANTVGGRGKIIGVDMTPEMIDRARENARKGGYENVEFRLGEIENIPAADNSVDVVISNCVINLSPEMRRVFREAFRVLKPGGRLMVSDIVLLKELPDSVRQSSADYIACVAGAVMKDVYLEMVGEAGFRQVKVMDEAKYPVECVADGRNSEVGDFVASILVRGIRPPK